MREIGAVLSLAFVALIVSACGSSVNTTSGSYRDGYSFAVVHGSTSAPATALCTGQDMAGDANLGFAGEPSDNADEWIAGCDATFSNGATTTTALTTTTTLPLSEQDLPAANSPLDDSWSQGDNYPASVAFKEPTPPLTESQATGWCSNALTANGDEVSNLPEWMSGCVGALDLLGQISNPSG